MNVPTSRTAAEIRKQRLLREIAGDTEDSAPSLGSFAISGAVVLALVAAVLFSDGLAEGSDKVATAAAGRTVTSPI